MKLMALLSIIAVAAAHPPDNVIFRDLPNCGRQAKNFEPIFPPPIKIIANGTEAKPHSWPWLVYVKVKGFGMCGGSLVAVPWLNGSSDVVATAHHCFENEYTQLNQLYTNDVQIIAGLHHSGVFDSFVTTRYWSKYLARQADNIIIWLDKPIIFTNAIQPICMPVLEDLDVFANKLCVIAGWGLTKSNGVASHTLQQLVVNVESKEKCRSAWSTRWQSNFNCVTPKWPQPNGHGGACGGDSGGPLMCQHNDGRWFTYGTLYYGDYFCGAHGWNGGDVYEFISRKAVLQPHYYG